MAITTFDTLKFVRRLEEAGVPSKQAEVQAEVLTEAFNVNLESLVTKDYLTARFAEQRAYVDTRFSEQNATIDGRFAEQRAYMDTRFAEQKAGTATNFRVLFWIQGILVAGLVLPFLERLMAL